MSIRKKIETLSRDFKFNLREFENSPQELEKKEAIANIHGLVKILDEFGYASEFWELDDCPSCDSWEEEYNILERSLQETKNKLIPLEDENKKLKEELKKVKEFNKSLLSKQWNF